MPAQALYLKYRPQTFDDVLGQTHITQTLKNALALNRVAHAYLFTGTRGTGKTSTARILAKAVNCLSDTENKPCNRCTICRAINEERLLDLVEIDAASNTGVDNIRDLRDKIDFRPTEARYKVYIIDEVHMLSNAAFNALLKTLEEPPPHVIFILATTEVNRVPATITSRCQRFDFRRASHTELLDQLGKIAQKEGLDLEPAALELIARQASGSFRDGVSLLDQLTAYSADTITLNHVQNLLGAASTEIIREIALSIAVRDVARGVAALDRAADAGAEPRQIARDLVEYFRGVLLLTVNSDTPLTVGKEILAEMRTVAQQMQSDRVIRAIRLLSQAVHDLRSSGSPTLPLELAIVEATYDAATVQAAQPASESRAVTAPSPQPSPVAPPQRRKDSASAQARQSSTAPSPASATDQPTSKQPIEGGLTLENVSARWEEIITRMNALNKSAAPFLRSAGPMSCKDGVLTIGFFYPFHKEKFEKDKAAKTQLEKILSEMFSTPCQVKAVLSEKREKMDAAQGDPLVREAILLGGKIVDVEDE